MNLSWVFELIRGEKPGLRRPYLPMFTKAEKTSVQRGTATRECSLGSRSEAVHSPSGDQVRLQHWLIAKSFPEYAFYEAQRWSFSVLSVGSLTAIPCPFPHHLSVSMVLCYLNSKDFCISLPSTKRGRSQSQENPEDLNPTCMREILSDICLLRWLTKSSWPRSSNSKKTTQHHSWHSLKRDLQRRLISGWGWGLVSHHLTLENSALSTCRYLLLHDTNVTTSRTYRHA